MLLDVLQHPITADIILVSSRDTEETAMFAYYCSAKLRNVILEINQVLRLLMCGHIIEMDILIAPLKIVDNALVGQLLFHNENTLEKIDYTLFYVKMVKFSDHSFLVFQISLILIYEGISFIDGVSYIIKNCDIRALVELG